MGYSYYTRKRLAHPTAKPANNLSIILFVTLCTDKKKPILAHPDSAATILDAWRLADRWMVGRYVIMPNHIHLFCSPRDPSAPFKTWMTFWKSRTSRDWPRLSEHPLWQRDFWDTQLRRGESYSNKWDYVYRNPVRAGLVNKPEDWPYAGEINVLSWHDS